MAILSRGCRTTCNPKEEVAVAANAAPPTAMNARLVMAGSLLVIVTPSKITLAGLEKPKPAFWVICYISQPGSSTLFLCGRLTRISA